MILTPEQEALGRRNFMKVLAGTPALAALGGAAYLKGPLRGGPVRLGFIAVGQEGRVLLRAADPAFAEVRAICDINPAQLQRADKDLEKANRPKAKHYTDWKEMLQKEDLEAIVMAPPLWMHAELAVGCLEAGKHVLCEKMMAWDVAGCERMRDTARRNRKLLEIGYQRLYNPIYQAAHQGIIKAGVLGDVFHARLVWHRNKTWRRTGTPPTPDYDPSQWGYPTFDHLINWRLFWKYSQGLMAELGSHQINIVNWFFDSSPTAVSASGGVYRFKEGGREVHDHVYATFDYPGGRNAVFTSIESNAFEDYYEMYMGTKGTLVLRAENEAMLFEEGTDARATSIEVAAKGAGPVVESSESRPATSGPTLQAAPGEKINKSLPYKEEISRFCSAVRVGTPLLVGPDHAIGSARACIRANEAVKEQKRLAI
jgi:predicted dehydrogenase